MSRVRCLLVVALLAGACSGRSPTRCERTCVREAQCAEELGVEQGADLEECTEECVRLERDPGTRPSVEAHVACVDRAGACAAVTACR